MSKGSTRVLEEESLLALIQAISEANSSQVEKLLLELGSHREDATFKRMTELTRALQVALEEFEKSLSAESDLESTSLPDAATKLAGVIDLTLEAATATLDAAESLQELEQDSALALEELSEILSAESLTAEQKERACQILTKEKGRLRLREKHVSEVIGAQNFQDLSGQVLHKVIRLLTVLESHLSELVTLFGRNAQTKKAKRKKAKKLEVSGENSLEQNDVDDILDSFGF